MLPETEPEDPPVSLSGYAWPPASRVSFRTGPVDGSGNISVGISSFGASRQSPLAIIETADRALYQAKTRGRNCVAIYEDGVNSAAASRAEG